MPKDHIDTRGFVIILILTILWGLNYSAIKFSNTGLSPVFTTFIRSLVASFFGIMYCLLIKQPVLHRGIILFHGFVTGMLFGLEFVFFYLAVLYTGAARTAVLVYLSPFVVAIGAHMFLKEKLNLIKILGLICAFIGVYLVFSGKPAYYSSSMFIGDIFAIVASFLWAATTLYIKKYLAQKVHPINTFIYQLLFSVPILFICAWVIEKKWILNLTVEVALSLIFQSIVVAFFSYLAWFRLIHEYPVAKLSAFTFLTPVFGVIFGVLLSKEEITLGLIGGLILVSVGIYFTNMQSEKYANLKRFRGKG
ncbi:MAG TPA: DMT family transporter [Syntrophorhabdaceae bacterium]|nr:DMT family transporter [Syntrophorhabdaceae bacterium]